MDVKRAITLNAELRDQWSQEKYAELQAIWAEHKRPFAHLYGGRFIGDEVGPGWWPLLIDAFSKIDAIMKQAPTHKFNVVQIKEKFGGLRFYCSIHSADPEHDEDGDEVDDAIRPALYKQVGEVITEAEIVASKTCETCGEPGTLRMDGWLQTLCDTHAAGRKS